MRPADVASDIGDDSAVIEPFDAVLPHDSAADARPLLHATAVFAGSDATCAIDTQGAVYCWGFVPGPLGSGVFGPTATPVPIHLAVPAVSVAVGGVHACAIDRDGGLSCWGRNESGQLGSGSFADAPIDAPVRVGGVSHVVRVAAGTSHTCAVDASGALFCWGADDRRQLAVIGDSRCTRFGEVIECTATPQRVAIGEVVDVSAGPGHTCAVLRSGAVLCWGFNDTLQDGGTCMNSCSAVTCCAEPITVATSTAAAVRCGGGHTCVATPAGEIQCWGANDQGQLASTTITQQTMPVTIAGAIAIQLSAGGSHTCILSDHHEVACWGANSSGQLGEPPPEPEWRIHIVMPSALGVAAGGAHTCALATEGSVFCWGANMDGQLGNGSYFPTDQPQPVRL